MRVKYEAYNWLGKRVTGVVEVDSEEGAYETLRQEQLVPYRVREVRQRRSLVQIAPGLFRPKDRMVIDFTRQMATLLRSGIHLRSALQGLLDGNRSVGMREALRQVIQDIEAGMRLSVAFARHPTVFPGFYTRLMRVAEATGSLSVILEQLAQLLDRRIAMKERVKRALVYPAISMVVGAIAGFVLVTYSLPSLIELIGQFGGELPPMTQLLMNISVFLKAYGTYAFGTVFALAFVGWLYGRTKQGLEVRDRVLLRVPAVGKVVLLGNLFSLMSTLSTLLRGGLPPVESLRLAGQETGNIVVRGGLEQVAEDVTGGEQFSHSFARVPVFPSLIAQAMRSGEMAGTLPEVVDGMADYYQKELERAVTSTVELIQPVMIIVVALMVGFVAVAVLSGIYSTLGSIG